MPAVADVLEDGLGMPPIPICRQSPSPIIAAMCSLIRRIVGVTGGGAISASGRSTSVTA